MAEHGLTRRLGRELLRQAFYISLAVLVSMFAAGLMVEDVLLEQALESEAEYYWQRVEQGGVEDLPDTQNLTGFREGFGTGVPAELAPFGLGFHRSEAPRETMVYVSERNGHRLYLQFEAEQVDKLILIFGIVPLAIALIVVYLSTFLAYRVSRRAVSPVVSLAERVRQLDPGDSEPVHLHFDEMTNSDDDVRVLAGALEDLLSRVTEFTEREREFTRDASHELRTPLTVVRMALDRMDREPDLSDEALNTLQRIRNSAEDMESLTKAFLLLARELDQGLSRDWVCVNDIVETELERACLITGSSSQCRVEDNNRLWVFAPEKIVESVAGNLIRNAVTYADGGEVVVEINKTTLVIMDYGPGMGEEDLKQIFRPFVRKQRQRGGYGVGLTIVKRLTERFNWPLKVESEPGRGTRIAVSFPRGRVEAID
ncbi:MAG: HAMP domain-containing histidine kinase [Gammaproteobacteria bacterium]|nr:HAMP domain-containing histidine kinase [Gammaproteobacteria bacterium]